MRSLQIATRYLILVASLFLVLPSCQNRALMLRTKKDFVYDDVQKIPDNREYKIGLNDNLEIQIFPNKGALLLEGVGDQQGMAMGQNGFARPINSIVEFDGTIKIPVLGRISVQGLTIREAELLLEQRLSANFVDPYVNLRISNKRVILFPGESGTARVVPLANNNMNLLEVLASAGGIPMNGKSNKIKLIRGDLKNPKIYLIDLSTIEGMREANLIVEGNDIIYVEPRNDYVLNFLNRASPYLNFINIAFFIRFLFIN
jgi:polysaccharide export outer membrane protein